MSPTKKAVGTKFEHHLGHTGEELSSLEKQIEDLKARVEACEQACHAAHGHGAKGDVESRVEALEDWRRALRHHTHQFLHDTGWKEPQ